MGLNINKIQNLNSFTKDRAKSHPTWSFYDTINYLVIFLCGHQLWFLGCSISHLPAHSVFPWGNDITNKCTHSPLCFLPCSVKCDCFPCSVTSLQGTSSFSGHVILLILFYLLPSSRFSELWSDHCKERLTPGCLYKRLSWSNGYPAIFMKIIIVCCSLLGKYKCVCKSP